VKFGEAIFSWAGLMKWWLIFAAVAEAVSVPGDPEIRLQILPGSALPDQLAAQGYTVVPTGTTQRILAHAVAQPMTMSSSGALVAAIENSTRPTTVVITNAGIATVEMYDLRMP
jgi:hypothetical protein